MPQDYRSSNRRAFLETMGVGALGLALARTARSAGSKPLRGLFPIAPTPVTPSNELDLECLQNEIKFCNRFKVHGFAWPQIASGWDTLTEKERMDGMEAVLSAGKGGSTAIVIGVQDKQNNLQQSLSYAKFAAKNGADAIVSLPPSNADDKTMIEYYKTIGAATELPLFVQTRGDMSVDLIVEMFRQIPTMKCVKDEAGYPLGRIKEIRERTNDKLAVFSGNGVRTLIDEMRLGFAGHCPTLELSDFYASAFDLWHSGKQREAFDMFGRLQAFGTITGATQYLLVVRGVFKETTKTRVSAMMGGGPAGGRGAGGGRPPVPPLDEAGKQAIRDAWSEFMKPYLRA
jgi:4-hydroxy-tetrahydrodipicolinate synthase